MSRATEALKAIEFARGYTEELSEDAQPDPWFKMPAEGVTHLAWQVGHLAMAEYGLALLRQRGKRPEDDSLISEQFLKQYGRGSTPNPDPANQPTVNEIRGVFDRVHQQTIKELSEMDDAALDLPLDSSHPAFDDRYGALMFAAKHELIHAGTISLLRRLIGKAWVPGCLQIRNQLCA